MEHTLDVCPAWVDHRCILLEAIGGGDLLRPALVEAFGARKRGKCLLLRSSNANKGSDGARANAARFRLTLLWPDETPGVSGIG